LATKRSRNAGGGVACGCARTYTLKALLSLKSGRPLVWFSACESLTERHALGSFGSHFPIVSDSESQCRSTSDSATAPENALAALAIRMNQRGSIAEPDRMLLTPAR
jgi:hypothetical protein